jgi:hypothetical protein
MPLQRACERQLWLFIVRGSIRVKVRRDFAAFGETSSFGNFRLGTRSEHLVLGGFPVWRHEISGVQCECCYESHITQRDSAFIVAYRTPPSTPEGPPNMTSDDFRCLRARTEPSRRRRCAGNGTQATLSVHHSSHVFWHVRPRVHESESSASAKRSA